MKHILIVDEHAVVRLATRFVLSEIVDPVTIYEAATFSDALAHLISSQTDLVLLDVTIPGGEGVAMVSRLRQQNPHVTILIFSALDEALYAVHYLKSGANGFLSKHASIDEVKAAIDTVLNTGHYLSDKMKQQLVEHAVYGNSATKNPLECLSQRELQVMDLLLEGFWTKEIALKLNITGSSVSTYKARVFEKLEVSSLIELYEKIKLYRDVS